MYPPLTIDLWNTTTPNKFHIWHNAHIPSADIPPPLIDHSSMEHHYTKSVLMQMYPEHTIIANRKTYRSNCRQTYRLIYQTLLTQHTNPPPQYIAWINSSQMTQITYTTLYKHLELLCNDSLQLCIYMTSSYILPPNVWTISHPNQLTNTLP